jgi:hypothetical protein
MTNRRVFSNFKNGGNNNNNISPVNNTPNTPNKISITTIINALDIRLKKLETNPTVNNDEININNNVKLIDSEVIESIIKKLDNVKDLQNELIALQNELIDIKNSIKINTNTVYMTNSLCIRNEQRITKFESCKCCTDILPINEENTETEETEEETEEDIEEELSSD